MTCPQCGTQLETGARFCGACGAKLVAEGKKPQVKEAMRTWNPDGGAPPMPAKPAASSLPPPASVVPARAAPAQVIRPVAVTPVAPGAKPIVPANVANMRTQANDEPAALPPKPQPLPAPKPGPVLVPPPVVQRVPTPLPVPGYAAAGGSSQRMQPADPFLGKTLNNRYVVEAKLGQGGFGAVYRGRQSVVGREVALKVLHPDMARDPNLLARFRREGAVACNLRDAHTITTYDFDQTAEGVLYIAMELLKGRSLHDVFYEQAPLGWVRVFKILEQMCSSMGEAHRIGIVHRDIKPENIYLEDRPGHPDYVKILDFGIAKIVGGDSGGGGTQPQLTAIGQTLGTLEYMSPEQLMGKQLDGRSDIYAMGVVAYEMITGQLPFPEAKGPAELIAAQLRKVPPPPSSVRTDMGIPPEADLIILKALEKDRNKRWNDADAVAAMIAPLLAMYASGGSSPQRLATPVPIPGRAAATPQPAAYAPPPVAPPPMMAAGAAPMGPGLHAIASHSPSPARADQTDRTQIPPSTREAIRAAKGGSRTWLWILLVLIALAGAAVAVYFGAVRKH